MNEKLKKRIEGKVDMTLDECKLTHQSIMSISRKIIYKELNGKGKVDKNPTRNLERIVSDIVDKIGHEIGVTGKKAALYLLFDKMIFELRLQEKIESDPVYKTLIAETQRMQAIVDKKQKATRRKRRKSKKNKKNQR